jgi:cell division protein ZapA
MKQKEKFNKLNVPIFGDEYTIKGDADTSHIEEVASYVDKKMKELAKKYPVLSPKQVAVLTAVNIADELISLQEDYNDLIKLLDSNTGS